MKRLGQLQAVTGSRTILLITKDQCFHEALRALANTLGLLVLQAKGTAGLVPILRATKPMAVLLDLDLPDEAAWQTADVLLNETGCPTVILLTARAGQFDMEAAIRAGSLVSKSEPPHRLLEIIDEALQMPEINQLERNAIQRVLIRRLRPSAWAGPTTPAYRFWGRNE